MAKLFSYPLSVLYYLCFGLTLLIFHPIQWICFNLFGYQAHKTSVDYLQLCLMWCAKVLGTRFLFTNPYSIETGQPLIIVANHQSLHDIYPLTWFMRKHHPKFISKIELGKGIPSVSYNLKHGGAALIDRKNPKQSIPALIKFGHYIETNKRAAVIFPEGTRSKNGKPKTFHTKGLEVLFRTIPSAVVVPVSINNSWKMLRYGMFPMGLGVKITYTVNKPLKIKDFNDKQELIKQIEASIKAQVTP
ncbi:MAG: lysophospholipid acyltransferase family protein [Aestuariibaculum sp.]